MTPPERHEAVFYSDDRQLLNHLSRFIAAALNAGNGAVVVATRAHQESLVQSLEASGVDVAAALKQGRYIVVDAADALSSCMANGMFVSTDFSKASKISCSQRQVLSRESILASHFLENVWTFCGSKVTQRLRSRRKNSATNLPQDTLWIFFAGSMGVQADMKKEAIQRICAEHSAVYRK